MHSLDRKTWQLADLHRTAPLNGRKVVVRLNGIILKKIPAASSGKRSWPRSTSSPECDARYCTYAHTLTVHSLLVKR
jgi:hypothetical protein